jgi:hypothetical protein
MSRSLREPPDQEAKAWAEKLADRTDSVSIFTICHRGSHRFRRVTLKLRYHLPSRAGHPVNEPSHKPQDAFQNEARGLLINTARGSMVDTEALDPALDTDIVVDAGLDVLEGEELMEHEEELLQQPGAEEKLNLLVRNHIL